MLSRRAALSLISAGAIVPRAAFANTAREVTWDDLIPPGVPYAEIIGEGDLDEFNDTWAPIFDENATKLNEALNGAYIKLPGFIIPLEFTSKGVTDFMLVPYVGACIHVPPPPANQLVMVKAKTPWPDEKLWDAVWVIGQMRTQLQDTELGQTGYFVQADEMEVYVW
ncbi:MAG: DUF3299 domain-containing protein [Pseudomonadota bacterium]